MTSFEQELVKIVLDKLLLGLFAAFLAFISRVYSKIIGRETPTGSPSYNNALKPGKPF